MNTMDSVPFLMLLGGSFNPPHSGHFRIAIETAEIFRPGRTLFIPCATPPHKRREAMLPFHLRCAMLRAGIEDMRESTAGGGCPDFAVSEIEAERSGPSYTVDTLELLLKRHPGKRLAFVLGSEDYMRLDSWIRWRRLPELADLIVLPRRSYDPRFFMDATLALWPDAQPASTSVEMSAAPFFVGDIETFALEHGGRITYLSQPVLDISSSLVRQRFLQGRNLDFLVPPGVNRLLGKHIEAIRAVWQSEESQESIKPYC